jgi:hypothetical protein
MILSMIFISPVSITINIIWDNLFFSIVLYKECFVNGGLLRKSLIFYFSKLSMYYH